MDRAEEAGTRATFAPGGAGQRPLSFWMWTTALVVLCVILLQLQFAHIDGSLPYPMHGDEDVVATPASRMLSVGTLHPGPLIYPSFPKYLAALGMAFGFLRGAAHDEIEDVREIGRVFYPYYRTPRVMQGARQLFVVISIVTVAATGALAWLAFRTPSAILLAPLILAISPLFFERSWTYLNVDIVGACFTTLALLACLKGTRQPSLAQSAVIPGLLAGLSTGSKYMLAVVIVSIILAIVFYYRRGGKISAALVAFAAMVLAFVVVVPHSLIDIPTFMDGLAFNAHHYAQGHIGFDGDPGLPQLVYYGQHFLSDFGSAGIALAVIGAFAYCGADWRRAAILLVFPVALISIMASQRVHFTRNVLSLHPLVAMFMAYGVITAYAWASAAVSRAAWVSPGVRTSLSVVTGLLLILAAVPIAHVREPLRDHTDSRTRAQTWIAETVAPGSTIVVPTELDMTTAALETRGWRVVEIKLQPARDEGALQQLFAAIERPAVILVPQWGADARYPGQDEADALNRLARRWQLLRTFGTTDVLVNYPQPVPRGDPAFGVAALDSR